MTKTLPDYKIPEADLYRVLEERSVMRNNDEVVFYSSEPLKTTHKRLVRPVMPEIEALNPNYRGTYYNEHTPDISRALDDFYKLRFHLWVKMNIVGMSLEDAVANSIAYTYYDCMSGEAGSYYLAACRLFIERQSLDVQTAVYPGPDGSSIEEGTEGWYTLGDFLKHIENLPRLDMPTLLGGVSLPQLETE